MASSSGFQDIRRPAAFGCLWCAGDVRGPEPAKCRTSATTATGWFFSVSC